MGICLGRLARGLLRHAPRQGQLFAAHSSSWRYWRPDPEAIGSSEYSHLHAHCTTAVSGHNHSLFPGRRPYGRAGQQYRILAGGSIKQWCLVFMVPGVNSRAPLQEIFSRRHMPPDRRQVKWSAAIDIDILEASIPLKRKPDDLHRTDIRDKVNRPAITLVRLIHQRRICLNQFPDPLQVPGLCGGMNFIIAPLTDSAASVLPLRLLTS